MVNINDCRNKTDEEMVVLTINNPDWYFCLASRYEDKLMRYIRRVAGMNKEDSEDILQDVLIKVYQNLNSFDPRLKFSSWIYRITHNAAISAIRKSSVRKTDVYDEEDMHKFSDNFELMKELDNSFDKEDINMILSKMNQKYREVIQLRYLEEKDYVEIADILKKPVSTVGNLLSRGKVIFKNEYNLIHTNIK